MGMPLGAMFGMSKDIKMDTNLGFFLVLACSKDLLPFLSFLGEPAQESNELEESDSHSMLLFDLEYNCGDLH